MIPLFFVEDICIALGLLITRLLAHTTGSNSFCSDVARVEFREICTEKKRAPRSCELRLEMILEFRRSTVIYLLKAEVRLNIAIFRCLSPYIRRGFRINCWEMGEVFLQ